MRRRRMIRLAPTFDDVVARAEIAIAELAREAGVSASTIHHLRNPASHPERKGGGMNPATAWKLANAYARLARVAPDAAYAALIIEVAPEPGEGA